MKILGWKYRTYLYRHSVLNYLPVSVLICVLRTFPSICSCLYLPSMFISAACLVAPVLESTFCVLIPNSIT